MKFKAYSDKGLHKHLRICYRKAFRSAFSLLCYIYGRYGFVGLNRIQFNKIFGCAIKFHKLQQDVGSNFQWTLSSLLMMKSFAGLHCNSASGLG